MKSYLEKCQIFKPNKDNSNIIDITDDSESLIEDMMNLQKIKTANLANSNINNKIEVFNVKLLPTIFFIIYMVVIAIVLTNYAPHMYKLSKNKMLYKKKFEIKYIGQIIGDLTQTCKVNLIYLIIKMAITFSQFILMFTIICLTSLIKQRISVPELKNEKWRNYLILIS